MIRKIASALVLTGIASVALAEQGHKIDFKDHFPKGPDCSVSAPELDPSSMISGLTLLGGGLVLLRKRKN